MRKYTQFIAIRVALIIAVAAWAQQQGPREHNASIAPENDWSELMANMEKMHLAMGSIERTGDSDVDFVKLMLPHHQGAVDMAKTELLYGKDPQMRRLAQEIITDQESNRKSS